MERLKKDFQLREFYKALGGILTPFLVLLGGAITITNNPAQAIITAGLGALLGSGFVIYKKWASWSEIGTVWVLALLLVLIWFEFGTKMVITGTLTNAPAISGPVPNVEIRLITRNDEIRSTRTKSKGEFTFYDVPRGPYKLETDCGAKANAEVNGSYF